MELRLMTPADAQAAIALWQATPGVGTNAVDDTPAGLARFLRHNPTTCFVAEEEGRLAGTILAGHDGRRGYIYHAAVRLEFQGKGIGKQLADRACEALREEGITKAGMLVFATNEQGNAFWESQGWQTRPDLTYRNKTLNPDNL